MSVYRRGKIWSYHFFFEGCHIQESTGLESKTLARAAEQKRKLELRERRAGIERPARPPRFEDFVKTFLAWSVQQHRPKTHELHKLNCDTLVRCFAGKFLDEITPGMVEEFKLARARETRRNWRAKAEDVVRPVSPATVNRALTTLKLLFRQAGHHWPVVRSLGRAWLGFRCR